MRHASAAGDPDALTYEEWERIVEHLDESGIGAHVIFALGTGARQGEQLGLQWDDIRPLSVRIEKGLARVDGRYELVDPKRTGASDRCQCQITFGRRSTCIASNSPSAASWPSVRGLCSSTSRATRCQARG
jgi:hypothetical protein